MNGAPSERFDIEQQMYQYSYTFDAGDAEGWVNVFTSDGVFEVNMTRKDTSIFRIQGSDQLREFAEKAEPVLHHQSGLVFDEVSADTATTRAMVLVTKQLDEPAGPSIITHGVYHDQWRKTADGWRLSHRQFESFGYRARPDLSATEPAERT